MLFNSTVYQIGGGNTKAVTGKLNIAGGTHTITIPGKPLYIGIQYQNTGYYYAAYNPTGEKLEHMMHSGVYDYYSAGNMSIWCSADNEVSIYMPTAPVTVTWTYWYGYIPD